MIRALCEREYLQPSSVLSLDSDRVQRIEHSSGECVSCEQGDVTLELYRTYIAIFCIYPLAIPVIVTIIEIAQANTNLIHISKFFGRTYV